MGIEYFYQFIDRAVIDPVLQMSWADFLRKHPWSRDSLRELLTFALDPEPDSDALSRILTERSLRWTMKRSTPAYYFLNTLICHVPYLKSRCPDIWPEDLAEVAVLEATAVEAFLKGRIDQQTLWAVYTIDGAEDPREWVRLSRAEWTRIKNALGAGAIQKPIFPWQNDRCLEEDYSCLRLTDTKRFINFLTQAWRENWLVPRLRDEIREQVAAVKEGTPHFRDFDLPRKLVVCVNEARFERPCVLRYFG